MRRSFLFLVSFFFILLSSAQEEKIDMDMMNKIRKEGLENSKVMEIALYLTDVSGPRLTASPGYMRAATWAKNKLSEWGLSNATLEPWGEFGKGWEQTKCYVAMSSPYYMPLIAMPRAWTGSTPGQGALKGQVVLVKANDSAELMKYAGTLKDKIVMTWSSAKLAPSFEPDGRRLADSTLEKMAKAEPRPQGQGVGQRNQGNNPQANQFQLQRTMNDLINREKPSLVLTMTARGNDGTIFVSSGGRYQKDSS
ncbi:MAG TPA: peptidase M28, partial [Chitinophagaceae bacterium]|nr:peptidase M28 [Chitinophagaceae bacterium]